MQLAASLVVSTITSVTSSSKKITWLWTCWCFRTHRWRRSDRIHLSCTCYVHCAAINVIFATPFIPVAFNTAQLRGSGCNQHLDQLRMLALLLLFSVISQTCDWPANKGLSCFSVSKHRRGGRGSVSKCFLVSFLHGRVQMLGLNIRQSWIHTWIPWGKIWICL